MRNMIGRCVASVSIAVGCLILAQAPARADPRVELLEAARLGKVDNAKLLLLRGVDPNIREKTHGPVIVYAAREKSFAVVRALASDPRCEINEVNAQGEDALMFASLHGDLETVKLLLGRGAIVNRPGWTALHYAASGGHVAVARLLLEQHAYIDAASPGNVTPLIMAARHSQISMARMLVEEGADPTLKNDQGYTAADYWKRLKETAEETWMRQKAADFARRYGSSEASGGNGSSGGSASPVPGAAGGGTPSSGSPQAPARP